ncbi:MAG: hypothetical protein ACREPX_09145 [Rhodanobacteraceae bacterium]
MRWEGEIKRLAHLISVAAVCAGSGALAQETVPEDAAPALVTGADESAWSFSLAGAAYVVPDVRDYLQPTFTADRGSLHLEARYNYESLDTGSIWLGYNFSGGEALQWEFTPMLGGVFGDTSGIAPGYKLSVTYGKVELFSEGEYVFDTGSSDESFFYNWTELSFSPVEWFRFGLVGQRTRAYQTDVENQRGLLVGFSNDRIDFTTYVFDLYRSNPTWVVAVAVDF